MTIEQADDDVNRVYTTYAYDKNGNVIERIDDGKRQTDGSILGRKHVFSYDPADWLQTHLDNSGDGCQRVTTTYLPTGWLDQKKIERSSQGCSPLPSFNLKQTTTRTYFRNGDLKSLTTKDDDNSTTEHHDVSYVNSGGIYMNGHRVKDTFWRKAPTAATACQSSASPCRFDFTYDARDRLTQQAKVVSGTTTTNAYSLDPAGSIVSESKNGSTVASFEYNGTSAYDGTRLTQGTFGSSIVKYFYDVEGRLKCQTQTSPGANDCATTDTTSPIPTKLLATYSYDAFGRLEKYRAFAAGQRTDKADYAYDVLDRLVEETEEHGLSTSSPKKKVTGFSYVGLTAQTSKETIDNVFTGAADTTKTYSYDAFGDLVSMKNDPTAAAPESGKAGTFTYGYDVHGSVSQMLDEQGNVAATYAYTPYGNSDTQLTDEVDPASGVPDDQAFPLNPVRYSAHRLDTGSKTYDMGFRRFGTDTGRFLTPDFYQGALDNLSLSSDPLTGNRYALASGNPVSYVEWDGHRPVDADGGTNDSAVANMNQGEALSSGSSAEFIAGDTASVKRIRRSERALLAGARDARIPFTEQQRNEEVALDVLGAILDPVDALRCGIDAVQGDWSEAGLNCVAVLPIFGQPIKGALKYGDEVTEGVASGLGNVGATLARRPALRPTQHYLERKLEPGRQVRSSDVLDAYRNPLRIRPVRFDDWGRPSILYQGLRAQVAVNPWTGDIVTVFPMGTRLRNRLQQGVR